MEDSTNTLSSGLGTLANNTYDYMNNLLTLIKYSNIKSDLIRIRMNNKITKEDSNNYINIIKIY